MLKNHDLAYMELKMPNNNHHHIIRTQESEDTHIEAIYSSCERYKYQLTRTWYRGMPKILFVLLNPSTASRDENDQTVAVCEDRSRRLGYGAMRICNLFAWIATEPEDMMEAKFPVGPENDGFIAASCQWANEIVAGWGDYGAYMRRHERVKVLLGESGKRIKVLGFTEAGHPRHPLYVRPEQALQLW